MYPNQIDVMIWYYVQTTDYPNNRVSDGQRQENLHLLVKHGLLRCGPVADRLVTGQVYDITDRGRAYVQAMMAVPLPEQMWVVNVEDFRKRLVDETLA